MFSSSITERTRRFSWPPLLAAFLIALVALPASGELVLPSDHSWGVESPAGTDEVVEYLLCDLGGSCQVWALGDASLAALPVRVTEIEAGIKTLRARYCTRNADGGSSGDCGSESAASSPFRFDPSLALTEFLSLDLSRAGDFVELQAGQQHEVVLPTGIAPPVADALLRVDLNALADGSRVRIVARGVLNPNQVYLVDESVYAAGEAITSFAFASLEDALSAGETALTVIVHVL